MDLEKKRYIFKDLKFKDFQMLLKKINAYPHMINQSIDLTDKQIKNYWYDKIAELIMSKVFSQWFDTISVLSNGKREDLYFIYKGKERFVEVKNTIIRSKNSIKNKYFEYMLSIPTSIKNNGGFEQITDICSQTFIHDKGETFDLYYGYNIIKANDSHIKWAQSFNTKIKDERYGSSIIVKYSKSMEELKYFIQYS